MPSTPDRQSSDPQPVDSQPSLPQEYANKLQVLLAMWEAQGVNFQRVCDWIDEHLRAARVAERFRREQPQLAAVVAEVKTLDSPGQVQACLESWIRQQARDEEDAYRQLTTLAQGFLVAPTDAEGFCRWFQDVHQSRWQSIQEMTELSEDELVELVRQVIEDDGLSAAELFEKMIELSERDRELNRRTDSFQL